MQLLEDLQTLFNVISFPLVIVSILALLRQNRQLERSIKSQVYQSLIENSLKIDSLLIENPEFRKYIYNNEAITEDTPELDKLMAVMEFMMDVIDNLKAQEKYIPGDLQLGWQKFGDEYENLQR